MVNSYYTGKVREELEERERQRELKMQVSRERVRKMTSAYTNMNHHSSSKEQRQMYEVLWKSLL
jgi:predicted translin family RNA/ssDNA-binding protein